MRFMKKYWFIAAFILILLLPLYGRLLDGHIVLSGVTAEPDKVDANAENIGDGSYQSYLNNAWENAFPGKKFLLKTRNQLLYSALNVSPNKNVIIGKNDSLFEPAYILCEVMNWPPSPEEYFDTLGENIRKLADLLAENGKELYVFITPSKAHFCREDIPDKYLFLDRTDEFNDTNHEQLIETLSDNGIIFYDSVSFIEEAKDSGLLEAPLYYETGIHWSRPWGETCAANLLDVIASQSQYDLCRVCVTERKSDTAVEPDTDLYDSLNLIKDPEGDWYDADMQISEEGSDHPSIFLRGGSFMGQSLFPLMKSGVFGEVVHFENNYYHTKNYSAYNTLSAFDAYDEIDLDTFVGQSDIVILEVNESTIDKMSWGFIEELLEHPEYLDRTY